MKSPRAALEDVFRAAIAAVDPYRTVSIYADEVLDQYSSGGFERLYVIGFGKAAPGMIRAMRDRLGSLIAGGVAVTKYGHGSDADGPGPVRLYEGGHPLPDGNGAKATVEIMKVARGGDEKSLVVCLISGGGSALLVAPYPGVSLAGKQETTDLLLKAGADIGEMNTVRKHISAVKGGRLAEMAYPASVRSLILSDVIGDRIDVIASGPTAPDPTTFSDALDVMKKFGLEAEAPKNVYDLLTRGAQGFIPETPKAANALFGKVANTVIGSNRQAIEAARLRCAALGFEPIVLERDLAGEAREIGGYLAREAMALDEARKERIRAGAKVCLISGGESTVTVRGHGTGGRNMELALAFALAVENKGGIALLSAGTDGTDGPTDAAGAFVDSQSAASARLRGLSPEEFLSDNDSYTFFARTNGLFITGATGTNVMDLQLILLYP